MLRLESVALELFEYKVEDISEKRAVRGGVASAWELYHHLFKEIAILSSEERTRLERAGRTLRRISESPKVEKGVKDTFINLVLEGVEAGDGKARQLVSDPAGTTEVITASDPVIREEQAVLQRLAQRVWWHDIESFFRRMAASWRAERDRYTARLIYATLKNLNRYSHRDTFKTDLNLAHLRIVEPIPERDDPLVSFNDLDSLTEIVRELVDWAMHLGRKTGSYSSPDMVRTQALDYLKRAALAVARDPYAGKTTLHRGRGASSKQLRLAIQELSKERLRDKERIAQRRDLEQRLQEALAFERNQRQMFQQDVQHFTALVTSFFERLAKYLPRSIGGEASEPQLQGGILFAANPALRWESVPPATTALTVNIKGPVRFSLAGIEIALVGPQPIKSLFIGDKELTLEPRMIVPFGRRRVLVFHEGRYVHFKVQDEARALATMVAEALTIYFVQESSQRQELFTVLKVVANAVVGEPEDLLSRALERIDVVTAKAPKRQEAIEKYLKGAARAAEVVLADELLSELARHLYRALTANAADLSAILQQIANAETAVYQLTGEPLSLELSNCRLTIRQYRGRDEDIQDQLVVMLPGQLVGSFNRYLIAAIPSGTLLCARGEQDLAVILIHEEEGRSTSG